ncbi:MAG: flippase-like domain-containing protein [Vicingus serpentipes]|nr:flippase-like domain-containing protein [Vicingus serpentipes]
MKKIILAILKTVIPLGLGIFLIWLAYNKLTPEQIERAQAAIYEMKYFYLGLSVLLGILSHASRAWRWKYPLEALGYTPRFWNSFFTVMIGYFANLGIPRSGEVLRCGVMAKYENMSFNKLVGTVIAERVADFILLIASICLALFLQSDLILDTLASGKEKFTVTKIIIALGGLVLMVIGFLIFRKSKNVFVQKVKGFVDGILEGVKTIFTMEKKWAFIGHTFFIWIMYFMMFQVTFYALPELMTVPFSGIFTAFVVGGLTIALTNGGIGAYPLGISVVLALYGLEDVGYGFGWAVWVAQSGMIIVVGLISFLVIPVYNRFRS